MLNDFRQIPGNTEANSAIDSTIFDKLRKLFGGKNFTLSDAIGHHFTLWGQMQVYYQDLIEWYEGKPLDETYEDPITKRKIDKYPLHINPIQNTCEKHAAVLIGSTLDGIRFGGVPIQFIVEGDKTKDKGKSKAKKPDGSPVASTKPEEPKKPGEYQPPKEDPETEKQKQRIEDSLVNVFKQSGGGSTFVTQATRSQYMGGTVWAVHFRPDRPDEEKIIVEIPEVKEFLGFPEGPNMDVLREAWIIREISALDAAAYGYPVGQTVSENKYYYIEYWNKESYSMRVNDWVIEKDGEKFEGPNPWGIVPVVYIPHIRVSGFLGRSIINKTLKGVIKEMNLRQADLGDAVNEDSHNYVAVRNVRGGVKSIPLPDGRVLIDLGSASGLGTGEKDPDMISVQTKSTSEPMLKVNDRLEKIYRRDANHPAVADGEDEGSQRSSLTLTTRMWPLVAHAEAERIHWTTGMLQLCKIILTIMAKKGLNEIVEEDLKAAITIKWSQMLPRDRDALVDEVVARAAANLGSMEHLLELLGDVYDIEGEVAKIKASKDEEAEAGLNREIKKANSMPKPELSKDPGGPKGETAKKPSGE